MRACPVAWQPPLAATRPRPSTLKWAPISRRYELTDSDDGRDSTSSRLINVTHGTGRQCRGTWLTHSFADAPQVAINRACLALELGECKAALIVGGETAASAARAASSNGAQAYPQGKKVVKTIITDGDTLTSEEIKYALRVRRSRVLDARIVGP